MTHLRPFAAAGLALLTMTVASCALPPTSGVVRLYDGVFKAPDQAQALAYCHVAGEPIRFLDESRGEHLPKDGVLFRCD